MEHQKVGLAWMKRAEESSNKGGILADDMGLGKTIQTLALMVSMKSTDPSKKTNLIIAPVALLSQWQREINQKLKSDHGLDSFILHGPKKSGMSWTRLKQYDVVLTTYGTLASEYRSQEVWEDRLNYNPHLDPRQRPSLLLLNESAKWYRVICGMVSSNAPDMLTDSRLDEAQCIKNVSTKSSKGACALKADFRWCLSGTPMQSMTLRKRYDA
jgi:SNF2 family DNA or RNA helicase